MILNLTPDEAAQAGLDSSLAITNPGMSTPGQGMCHLARTPPFWRPVLGSRSGAGSSEVPAKHRRGSSAGGSFPLPLKGSERLEGCLTLSESTATRAHKSDVSSCPCFVPAQPARPARPCHTLTPRPHSWQRSQVGATPRCGHSPTSCSRANTHQHTGPALSRDTPGSELERGRE